MTAIELDGWIAAIQQLTSIQSAGSAGARPESKRIVSKRKRKSW
jgi:hypothetical protein